MGASEPMAWQPAEWLYKKKEERRCAGCSKQFKPDSRFPKQFWCPDCRCYELAIEKVRETEAKRLEIARPFVPVDERRIAKRAKELGITMGTLAMRASIPAKSMLKWDRDATVPKNWGRVLTLCKILQCEPSDIFNTKKQADESFKTIP